jgi:hypothetical protein
MEVDTQNLARKVGGVGQMAEVGNAVGLSTICFIKNSFREIRA